MNARTRGDPRRTCDLFGLTVSAALRCASTVEQSGLVDYNLHNADPPPGPTPTTSADTVSSAGSDNPQAPVTQCYYAGSDLAVYACGAAENGERVMGGARVDHVVQAVAAERAPDELKDIQELLTRDADEVTRAFAHRQKVSPLGFGTGAVAVLVTPLVWMVLQQFAQELTAASARTLTQRAHAWLQRLLRRTPPAVTVLPQLDGEQLDRLHRIVKERARETGMGEQEADRLASCVISHIVRNQ
nr:hypothetical protein [Streptomyces hygroscopicus]